MKQIYKLGNGNILVVHDVDLEPQGQVWYEEINSKQLKHEHKTEHIGKIHDQDCKYCRIDNGEIY